MSARPVILIRIGIWPRSLYHPYTPAPSFYGFFISFPFAPSHIMTIKNPEKPS